MVVQSKGGRRKKSKGDNDQTANKDTERTNKDLNKLSQSGTDPETDQRGAEQI